jgi:WD40 repeat protein
MFSSCLLIIYNYKNMMQSRLLPILLLIGYVLFATPSRAQTVEWSKKANPDFLSINSVAFRADGQQVLSGTNCHPASIRIFEVSDGSLTWDYNVGFTYMCIMGVSFSANSNYIAAMEEFGNLFLFDNTGVLPVIMDTINAGTSYGYATDISPNNDKVAVGLSSGRLKLYNLPDGSLAYNIFAHGGAVTTVSYSPDGTRLVTGGNDGKVKIWTPTVTPIATGTGHVGKVTQVRVTPDNQYVVSSGIDNTIKIWDITSGALLRTLIGHADFVNSVDVSPDGTRLVSGCFDGNCKIWDFATGAELATFGIPDSGSVNSVAWSPNGDKIVTGNSLSDLVLWSNLPAVGVTDPIAAADFMLIPNPSNDMVRLETDWNCEDAEVAIYNEVGQRLIHIAHCYGQAFAFETSHLPSGMYMVHLVQGDRQVMRKLSIQH